MDPRAGVRITALEAAGAWLRDSELSAALVERCERGALREREVALRALAVGRDPRAAELAAAAAAATEASLRAQAAAAAAEVGEIGLLEKLAADGEPAVRIAAFEGLLAQSSDPLAAAHAALADPDPAVRATALDWLTEHPGLAAEPIRRAMAGPGSARLVDVRLSGVRALAARAAAEPLEREEIVAALEELARDADFLVRRDASQGLARLGLPAPPVGPVETGKGLAAYRGIVQRTHRSREVVLTTERGAARIRLACPQAPLTCLNFLQLVRQGFYDGLRFHRVVPDFVVQDGDPRGDGWGGPGYTIRDEINRLRYGEGVVGMALSGPDTGGSQFFVTLSAQPHLDGGYTAFGEVVAGMEVIRGILQGDRVLEAEEAEEAEGAREGEGAKG
jgi:cyclophilin family peptidyl-prolyl cis-trans isomerase